MVRKGGREECIASKPPASETWLIMLLGMEAYYQTEDGNGCWFYKSWPRFGVRAGEWLQTDRILLGAEAWWRIQEEYNLFNRHHWQVHFHFHVSFLWSRNRCRFRFMFLKNARRNYHSSICIFYISLFKHFRGACTQGNNIKIKREFKKGLLKVWEQQILEE